MPSDFWLRTMHDAENGHLSRALAAARMRQRMKPRDAEACKLLGLMLQRSGELEQAIHFLSLVTRLDPASAMHHHHLAVAQMQASRAREALASWERALHMDASIEDAWLGLCAAHLTLDDAVAAVEAARRGLELVPHWPALTGNLSNALCRLGRTDEAIVACERALERHPAEHALRSNVLFMLSGSSADPERVLQAHRDFGLRLPAPKPPAPLAAHGRPLRVGVLSSDLRSHSVGYFAAPWIEHAPPDAHLIAFVAGTHATDPLTARLRAAMRGWHVTSGLDDSRLDALLRSERLDMLVELNGHTTGGRLPALARQPAPVIVSAIGYPNTTGVPAVGWRLADSITDPPGAERWCTERLLRLDPCFLCFSPPEEAPDAAMPAADSPITFGSFNNVTKISNACIDLWADTLHAVPNSRLLLKFLGSGDPAASAWIIERFVSRGILRERVAVAPYTPDRRAHLAQYHRVHVALDTSPYSGTTTTCEALWMGVPVVTLPGERHVSRVSASLLAAAGHHDCIADSAASFTRVAARLVADLPALATMRATARDRLRRTPLLDAPAYARRLHAAWRSLCDDAARGA